MTSHVLTVFWDNQSYFSSVTFKSCSSIHTKYNFQHVTNSCFRNYSLLAIKSEPHISECLTEFEILSVIYWFEV